MMWFDGQSEQDDVICGDRRLLEKGENEYEPGFSVCPDVLLDSRQLPFKDDTFSLVAYDPPHFINEHGMSHLSGVIMKKYGALRAETWRDDLVRSFRELWRVLESGGTLTFKWADRNVSHDEIIDVIDYEPLYGTRTAKRDGVDTRWWVFHK